MKPNHPLLKIAQNQSGLFTAHQAIKSGIDYRNHSYHLKTGNWLRVEKGIYHLNIVPEGVRKDFFLFQLWARNRKGKQVGVFSYETAFFLMGIEKTYPKKIHITIPINFRRAVICNDQLELHYEDLSPEEKVEKDGLSTTNVKRTFQDILNRMDSSAEWIKQKLKKAVEKKLITIREIEKIPIHNRQSKQMLKAVLFELCD